LDAGRNKRRPPPPPPTTTERTNTQNKERNVAQRARTVCARAIIPLCAPCALFFFSCQREISWHMIGLLLLLLLLSCGFATATRSQSMQA
jgi:hypothetical protein